MRARRRAACGLALSLVGCHAVTYSMKEVVVRQERRELGRDPAPLVRVDHHPTRDLLALTVGDLVTVQGEDVRDHERQREWDLAYYSLTDQTGSEDDFSLTLLLLPITLPIDLLLPVLSVVVLPFRLALGEWTAEWTTRTPVTSKEERPWARYDLVDRAADARVTVRAGEPLRAGDLALSGVRSPDLVAVGPDGLEREVTLPPSAAASIAAVGSALAQVDPRRVVRVAPGERLTTALLRALPGAWLQLEEGEYELEYGPVLFNKRLTIAGRGAALTVLRCRGSTGLDLRGPHQDVTLRGLSIVLDGAAVSDGVRCRDGVVRLIGCEVRGARHEKVPPPPDAPPGQGDSYRGGIGVAARGGGKVLLEACRLVGNQTAGALASSDHEVVAVGCVAETGALEAFSFRGKSRGAVRDALLSGPGHGVLVGGEARATVSGCEIRVGRAGVLVNEAASATVERNTLVGCTTGASIEDASSATVDQNVCRENQTGVLVSSTGKVAVTKNTCAANKSNGISVQGAAGPAVTGNTCEGNGTGILFTGTSGGRAAGNTLAKNGAGVAVQDQARPQVISNTITGSKQAITVAGAAAPTINRNTCRSNFEGLHVEGSARPEVFDNTFEENQRGAVFLGQASGSFTGNRVRNNRGPGVANQSGGGPKIQHNTVSGNNPNTSP
ncbi:MAG: right-handed parallel beta-helix repeat-containing protein [Planctomycetes bacterium]|nr:right-handed parallel beta-helix repeat-containing protein [Planctomycetota bacterium]